MNGCPNGADSITSGSRNLMIMIKEFCCINRVNTQWGCTHILEVSKQSMPRGEVNDEQTVEDGAFLPIVLNFFLPSQAVLILQPVVKLSESSFSFDSDMLFT